jgi:hypothetical protein
MTEAIVALYTWLFIRVVSALLVAFTFLVFALFIDFTLWCLQTPQPYIPWWKR